MPFFYISASKSGLNMRCLAHGAFWLGHVLRATTACSLSTSQLPRRVLTWSALHIVQFDSACNLSTSQLPKAAWTKAVLCIDHYWIIDWLRHVLRAPIVFIFSTSQFPKVVWAWGPSWGVSCIVYFDLDMCFEPHRPALFPHLNFSKSSDAVSLSHLWHVTYDLWLTNVLRATTPWILDLCSGSLAPHLLLLWIRKHKSLEKHCVSWLSCLATFLGTFIFFLLTFSSLTCYSIRSYFLFWLSALLFICPYCREFDSYLSFTYGPTVQNFLRSFYMCALTPRTSRSITIKVWE